MIKRIIKGLTETEDKKPGPTKGLDEQYVNSIRNQQSMRREANLQLQSNETHSLINAPRLVSTIARNSNNFNEDLLVAASNDFGQPVGVAPMEVQADMVFDHLKQEIIEEKWQPTDRGLRDIWRQVKKIEGIHTAIPFLWNGKRIKYDITPPGAKDYTFLTLRDATGLVDWISSVGGPQDGVIVYK